MSQKNVGVFVDVASLHRNIKSLYNGKLDYAYYLSKCKELGTIYRALAFGCQIDDNAKKFISCLRLMDFEPRYIEARTNKEGRVFFPDRTIAMIADIMRMIDKLDIVVIGTSNPTIVPILEFIKERGIKIVVFSCNIPVVLKNISDKWWEITDEYLEGEYIEEDRQLETSNAAE